MNSLPTKAALMARALTIARGMVGLGRDSAAGVEQITHFLAMEGLPYTPETAYCISGVSWCYCKALADLLGIAYTPETAVAIFQARVKPILDQYYFHPSASCSDVVAHMTGPQGRYMRWYPADQIGDDVTLPAGAIVLYTWAPGEHHAEMLEADGGDTLNTVGFNVSCPGHPSGMIAEKTREDIWPFIWGFLF